MCIIVGVVAFRKKQPAQIVSMVQPHTPAPAESAVTPALIALNGTKTALARTNGPFYGDLHEPGELARAVRLVSRRREIVLLHGDGGRLRMLVNLVANLNELDIFHILLLGFSEAICSRLRRRAEIGCAHSSFLHNGSLGERVQHHWKLKRKYVAWIQKFHYMRLLIEGGTNVLALDSDVLVNVDPYQHLHGSFGKYRLVTAFDTKGGFANINVGIVYVNNATLGGAQLHPTYPHHVPSLTTRPDPIRSSHHTLSHRTPTNHIGPVHELFVEFERRVESALMLHPPKNKGERESRAVRFFWDQNLFNKVTYHGTRNYSIRERSVGQE